MVLDEAALARVGISIITQALKQEGVTQAVRRKLGRDPAQRSFQHALHGAVQQLQHGHPEWTASLFDASFMDREAAHLLARLLVLGPPPDPSELARCWADALNLQRPELRSASVRELEPVAAAFLEDLAVRLRAAPELRELLDSRALDSIRQATEAIRSHMEADRATSGTHWDYLRWLRGRNAYLDVRGIAQTQRQVQVKLDKIYVTLTAAPQEARDRRQERPDRHHRDDSDDLLELKQRPAPVSLTDAVMAHRHLVVLGDPGGGKTTLLRYLALQHATALWTGNEDAGAGLGPVRFPILIRVASYAENGAWRQQSLTDFLPAYHRFQECAPAGLSHLLHEELEAGRCLVLLDGLDEIVEGDDRRGVANRIEDFVRRHDTAGNRFIATSRISGYDAAPLSGSFVHLIADALDDTQITQFVERWCHAVEDAQAPEAPVEVRRADAQREIDGILRAVKTSVGVNRLAANPLMLCTLALIHRTGARLSAKRIELYKLAADVLARTWRTAQGVPESALVKEEYVTRLLSQLAYWMHEHKPTGIATEAEVIAILGPEWARIKGLTWDNDDPNPDVVEDVKDFLQRVRDQTGLFVERAPHQYGFMHLTFEEYYAARFLVARQRMRGKMIRKHLHDPRWDEPILLGLAFVGLDSFDDAAELVATAVLAEGLDGQPPEFLPSPYEDLLGRDFRFALRCLADEIPFDPEKTRELVNRLVDQLAFKPGCGIYGPYRAATRRCAENLAETDVWEQLLQRLAVLLAAPDAATRTAGAKGAFFSYDLPASARQSLAQTLLGACRDEEVLVRRAALLALPNTPDSTMANALIEASRDINPDIRRLGIRKMSLSKRREEIIALKVALNDPDLDVRVESASQLSVVAAWEPSDSSESIAVAALRERTQLQLTLLDRKPLQAIRLDIGLQQGRRLHTTGIRILEHQTVAVGIAKNDPFTRIYAWTTGESNELKEAAEAALEDSDPSVRSLALQWITRNPQHITGQQILRSWLRSAPTPEDFWESMIVRLNKTAGAGLVQIDRSTSTQIALAIRGSDSQVQMAASTACSLAAADQESCCILNEGLMDLLGNDTLAVQQIAAISLAARIDKLQADPSIVSYLIGDQQDARHLGALAVLCAVTKPYTLPPPQIDRALLALATHDLPSDDGLVLSRSTALGFIERLVEREAHHPLVPAALARLLDRNEHTVLEAMLLDDLRTSDSMSGNESVNILLALATHRDQAQRDAWMQALADTVRSDSTTERKAHFAYRALWELAARHPPDSDEITNSVLAHALVVRPVTTGEWFGKDNIRS